MLWEHLLRCLGIEVDDRIPYNLIYSQTNQRKKVCDLFQKPTFSAKDSIQALRPGWLFRLSLMKYETRDDGNPAADRMLSMS